MSIPEHAAKVRTALRASDPNSRHLLSALRSAMKRDRDANPQALALMDSAIAHARNGNYRAALDTMERALTMDT